MQDLLHIIEFEYWGGEENQNTVFKYTPLQPLHWLL